MKNAGIKSKREAAQRLLDGEVFYNRVGDKIYFNESKTSPFLIGNTILGPSWGDYKSWQTKPDWRDEVSEDNPVLCWVWNEKKYGVVAKVRNVRQDSKYQYSTTTGEHSSTQNQSSLLSAGKEMKND